MSHSSQHQRSSLQTPKNQRLLEEQKEQDIHTPMACRDIICAVIFFCYMIAMVVIMGLALYNGNYSKLGAVVDESNVQCGKDSNAGFPYLLYSDPCDGMLTKKVCVSSCPDSTTAPNCNSARCSNSLSLFVDCTTSGCTYYDSYAYLQRICLPKNSTGITLVETNMNNYPIDISMSNVSETYVYLLIFGAGIVGITFIAFLLFLACPRIIYVYITISFLGLLFLAFFMMKISQLKAAQTNYTTIVTTDEQKSQIISLILFAFFFLTSPLILFGYRRLNFAVKLINVLRRFFRRMVTMHFFNLLLIILVYTFFGFQVFVLCNLYTYGTVLSNTTSPFYSFSSGIVGIPIAVFQIIGTYWIFTFLVCYCQFIISCNMYIWFYEETEDLPAFSPLRRSLGKSMYHLGSIALDAFLIPFTWILLTIYQFLRYDQETEQQFPEGESNVCSKFLLKIWRKFVSLFEIMQNYLNRGSYCSMVQKNTHFFESNRLYAYAIKNKTRNLYGLGTHLTIFATLFIITVALIVSYFVMYYFVVETASPPKVSSLAVPLSIILLLSLAIGNVFGSILSYSTDSLIYYHVTLTTKIDHGRRAYEVEAFLNEV